MSSLKIHILVYLLATAHVLSAQELDELPKLFPAYSEDFSNSSSFPSTCFQNCYKDKSGRLWLIPCSSARQQASLHLFQFDGYDFRFIKGEIENLPEDEHIIGIDQQRSKLVWFTTGPTADNALFFYNLETHQLRKEVIPLGGTIITGMITPDNRILLAAQQARRFWVGEWSDGQFRELGSFQHLEDLDQGSIIYHLNDQEIWFSIKNTGDYLTRFNFRDHSAKKYFFADFEPEGIPAGEASNLILPGRELNQPGAFYFLKQNRNTAQSGFSLYHFQKEKDVIERVAGQPDWIGSRSRAFQDESGNYLFLFADQNSNYTAILQDATGARYDYSAFFSDLGGSGVYSIWSADFKEKAIICSEKGIFAKQGVNQLGVRHFLPGVSIRAMVELPEQKVMISAQEQGNYVLDMRTNTVNKIKVPGCPFDVQFSRLVFCYDEAGKLLTSDQEVFIKYDTSTQVCESFYPNIGIIRSFTPIDADQVALLSVQGELYIYRFSTDQATPVLNNGEPVEIPGFPNGMHYDAKGRIWIPSNSGLWMVHLAEQKVEVLGKEAPFLDSRFLAMRPDEDGRLWLGTPLGGLHIFDPDTRALTIVNSDAGLANNTVANILEDEDGDWWLGTYNGISVVDRQGALITNLGLKDGLVEKENNRFASLKTKDGTLLIGTISGLHVIDPQIIKDRIQQSVPLTVYLTSLEYFDQKKGKNVTETYRFSDLPSLQLPPSHRFLNLSLALSNYYEPQKNQFAYMLEGLDSDWTFLGNQHSLSLNNLPAGRYRLLIKGRDADGHWTQEPLVLSIHAREFFYKSPWFYLILIFLLGVVVMIWILQLRQKIDQATEKIRADKAIIESQAERLQEKDLAKSLFFTNISHEFRTPLTVISGMANQIEGQEKIKDLIRRNSLSLLNMVNQILDLRKLELGKLTLDLVQGDIVQYLEYIVGSYEAIADLKGVKLHLLQNEKELLMDFDQEKLMRIISNLLSNAIKFTPSGGHVYLIVEQRTMDQEREAVTEALSLTVSDTGIGIPKEQQARIFERFFQVKRDPTAKEARSRNERSTVETTGTGIGLALTRDLITLMGGTISLESTPEQGSVFTVLLPIKREATLIDIQQLTADGLSRLELDQAELKKETDLLPTLAAPPTDRTNLSLLIIEDNRDVQQYLISLLEPKYTLFLADNGQEGIEMAFEHIPDLIISDVMMPKKDGFEVCDTLKNDDRTSHIPIILLTAKASVESRIQGLERGADAYLAKPFNEKELFIRLEKLAELRRLLQQRYRQIRPTAVTAETTETTDFAKEDAFMAKLLKVVEDNLDNTDFGPTQLCNAMGMSRSHLHLKIKALTDRSTSIFIRTIRLHKARALLQQGDLSVTQVACEVGFNDLSYFSKKFSAEFGVSPQKMIPS